MAQYILGTGGLDMNIDTSIDIAQLEQQLHQHFPPTRSLNIRIQQATAQETAVSADFASNKNWHNTVFGGSISLVATTCAWLLVHVNFPGCKGNIVIRQSHIRFLAPARGDLSAICRAERQDDWQNCEEMLARFGRGNINVDCQLFSDNMLVAKFSGEFVAYREKAEPA
jgi:thioesterase domain-containing protein